MLLLEAMACLSCGRQLAGLDCARVVLASDLQAASPNPDASTPSARFSDPSRTVAGVWTREVGAMGSLPHHQAPA